MTAPKKEDLLHNALLSILNDEDRQRLALHMMIIEMKPGDILQAAGDDVVNTWFPLDHAMAAFCVTMDDGSRGVEVAVIGREGAIGGIVSNGNMPAHATGLVHFGGRFLRIKTAALENAKLESISLRHWFSRYSDCLLAQVFQNAACNATHTIEQRTAKWLLAAIARTSVDEFVMTQDQLAAMLGVGRTFVNRVVGKLRNDGIVETRRGHFKVLDPQALMDRTCGCTQIIENHFDSVLHGIYPKA